MIRLALPADAEDIAKVHVDSWRSTYRGIVPDDFLAKLDYEQRANVRRKKLEENNPSECTYVVEHDGRIVGFAMGGPRREGHASYDGELYAIYVSEENKGQGHGRELTEAVARWLHAKEYKSMLVWVLDENPTKSFYEKLGAKKLESKMIEIGKPLLETSYGWNNLSYFLASGKKQR